MLCRYKNKKLRVNIPMKNRSKRMRKLLIQVLHISDQRIQMRRKTGTFRSKLLIQVPIDQLLTYVLCDVQIFLVKGWARAEQIFYNILFSPRCRSRSASRCGSDCSSKYLIFSSIYIFSPFISSIQLPVFKETVSRDFLPLGFFI
jgi:hypothetical protein